MLKREDKKTPVLSVVIPSLNKVGFIGETLESILHQNYLNLEIIIQDGGSTDGSLDIIKKYAKKYPNIIRWESGRDKGQLSAILSGIRKARGEIIAYINADDVYKRGAFKRVLHEYLKAPDCLWLVGYGDMINVKNQRVFGLTTFYKKILTAINFYPLLLSVNYIMQPTVFLTREAYNKFGPFTGTDKFILEYEMWLKLGRVRMPRLILIELASYRVSLTSITANEYKKTLEEDMKVVKKYTRNHFILALHKIHNYARTLLVSKF